MSADSFSRVTEIERLSCCYEPESTPLRVNHMGLRPVFLEADKWSGLSCISIMCSRLATAISADVAGYACAKAMVVTLRAVDMDVYLRHWLQREMTTRT